MNRKIKVAVLMGGKSSEHQVSVNSGKQVVAALNPLKFEVLPIIISKDGKRWQLIDIKRLLQLETNLDKQINEITIINAHEINGVRDIEKVDVVFVSMHGQFGEDGTMQGMLELSGIPFTGPGVLASALGMDKYRFGKMLEAEGLLHPKSWKYKKGDKLVKIKNALGGFPLVVKPNDQGSSVGVRLVKKINDFEMAIREAEKFSKNILIEEYINGMEVTCAVIGNECPIALPVVEIVPENEFFDYESKYVSDKTKEIVPARISDILTKKIKDTAVSVYEAVGARGFSRIDFIVKDNQIPYCLEINTIPGLTEKSLLPKAAKAHGMSYQQLIERIIELALERR